MLMDEVQVDTLQLLHTSLMSLRKFFEAKEAAILWGDLLGPSIMQLNALIEAAYFEGDMSACADAARQLQHFESAPDEEYDLPAMRPSAVARLRAACLAQDLTYQSFVDDPTAPIGEQWDARAYGADMADPDDFFAVLYQRWMNYTNAALDGQSAAVSPQSISEGDFAAHAGDARSAAAALAIIALIDAGRHDDAQAAISAARTDADVAASANMDVADALYRMAVGKEDDDAVLRRMLMRGWERGFVLLRKRAADHLA